MKIIATHDPLQPISIFVEKSDDGNVDSDHFATQIWSFGVCIGSQVQDQGRTSANCGLNYHKIENGDSNIHKIENGDSNIRKIENCDSNMMFVKLLIVMGTC